MGLVTAIFSQYTESRRAAIDILLKAAGHLDCAVRHVLPQLPSELRCIKTKYLQSTFSAIFTITFSLPNLVVIYWSQFDCRRNLPVDLAEGVLRALCLQALGQVLTSSLHRYRYELLGCLWIMFMNVDFPVSHLVDLFF